LVLLTVVAVFGVVPFALAASPRKTLSVAVSGKGRVTSTPPGVSCPGKCIARFASGLTVRLKPVPTGGWRFSRWGGACTSRGACSVKLSAPKTVRAVFAQLPPPPPPPGSSRDRPAPIGTTLAISTASAPTGWTLKVNSVTPDATDQIVPVDPDNIPPVPDQQYFMVSVTATYTGSGSADASEVPDGLNVVGSSDGQYQSASQDGCGVLPDPDFVLATTDLVLSPGASVTGNICWSVSVDDAASLEMYNDQTAPVWFALH
jgi:hypothetical protein